MFGERLRNVKIYTAENHSFLKNTVPYTLPSWFQKVPSWATGLNPLVDKTTHLSLSTRAQTILHAQHVYTTWHVYEREPKSRRKRGLDADTELCVRALSHFFRLKKLLFR